mgnify:CR=1 FL=1
MSKEIFWPTETPKMPCGLHPEYFYTHLCLSHDCIKRMLCCECLGEHREDHEIIPLKRLLKDERIKLLKAMQHDNLRIEEMYAKTLFKLNSIQTELARTFDQIERRIKDIFKNLSENSNSFLKWAEAYIDKAYSILSNPQQEDNYKILVDLYKFLRDIGDMYKFSPMPIIDDFLDKLSNWSMELQPLPSLLNKAYFKIEENFSDLVFTEQTSTSDYKLTTSRGGCSLGKYAAFSLDPSPLKKSPMLICGAKPNNSLYGSYHDPIDVSPIQVIEWLDKDNCFLTSSFHNIKQFHVYSSSIIRVLSIVKRNQPMDLKYIRKKNIVISTGMNPHLVIYQIRYSKIKTIGNVVLPYRSNEKCSAVAYIPHHEVLALSMPKQILIYHLESRNCLYALDTHSECLGLQYLTKREVLVVTMNVYIYIYNFNGCGRFSLSRKIKVHGPKASKIIANEEQTQLLLASNGNFLEVYDFDSKESQILKSPTSSLQLKELVYLKDKGLVIALGHEESYHTGRLCIVGLDFRGKK